MGGLWLLMSLEGEHDYKSSIGHRDSLFGNSTFDVLRLIIVKKNREKNDT